MTQQHTAALRVAYVRKPQSGSEKLLYQHDAYCRALVCAGFDVRALRHDADLPPARCFISDTAVMTDSIAVIARTDDAGLGNDDAAMSAMLLGKTYFIKCITAPGKLDAADVACVGGVYYIAVTARSNRTGVEQLAQFLDDAGQKAEIIDLSQYPGLRLSGAICDLGGNRALIHPALARHYAFLGIEKIVVPSGETAACEALATENMVILHADYTATADLLKAHGFTVFSVNISEFIGLGGGLCALSLRLPPRQANITVLGAHGLRRIV